MERGSTNPLAQPGISDPNGTAVLLRAAHAKLPAGITGAEAFGLNIGINVGAKDTMRLVEWREWSMPALDYAGRLFWVAFALGGTLLAAPFLDKAAAHAGRAAQRASGAGLQLKWLDLALRPFMGSRLGALAVAEIKGVLRPRRRLWWLAALGLMVGQAFAPGEGFAMCVMGGWLLSLDAFARLLLRERDHGTGALVFTAAGATGRLLAARAITALVLAWGFTLPAMLRMASVQPDVALAVALAGASLAIGGLALAAVCRNPRPFELLAIFVAYVSAQGAPVLNVMAAPATTLSIHAVVLPVAAVLALALWPRMRPAH
jgi:hypothetical protein